MKNWNEYLTGQSVVAMAIEALRTGISDGRYVPGQRLVEAELARELRIARHRGAVVRRFSRKEMADHYRVRELLEGLAARLAAERIDEDGNRARFSRAYKAVSRLKTRQDSPGYMDENIRFHRLIAEIGGNETLATRVAEIHLPVFRLQFRLLIHPEAQQVSYRGHDEIAAAILAGDAARAERVMRRHVRRSAKVFLALPDAAFGAAP
jgi:DNA-binding GntR family transcriptional regulator